MKRACMGCDGGLPFQAVCPAATARWIPAPRLRGGDGWGAPRERSEAEIQKCVHSVSMCVIQLWRRGTAPGFPCHLSGITTNSVPAFVPFCVIVRIRIFRIKGFTGWAAAMLRTPASGKSCHGQVLQGAQSVLLLLLPFWGFVPRRCIYGRGCGACWEATVLKVNRTWRLSSESVLARTSHA